MGVSRIVSRTSDADYELVLDGDRVICRKSLTPDRAFACADIQGVLLSAKSILSVQTEADMFNMPVDVRRREHSTFITTLLSHLKNSGTQGA